MKFLLKTIILAFLVFSPIFGVSAYSSPGSPTGFVNDYAGMLSSNEKASLEERLKAFKDETSNEISVVTIKSLDGDYIENYAVKLFEEWGIGSAENDNGVLLLIALDDKQMRIEVGYGLEGALPDAIASQIINNDLKPAFRSGEYYGGIDRAVKAIISATKGEYEPSYSAVKNQGWSEDTILFFLVFGFYFLAALWRFLAKSKSWWQGGLVGLVLGFIIALIISASLIILPLVFLILGLIFDYLVSRVFPKPKTGHRGGGPWFFGGGGFGGGSSGGGFGGFGGGSSGGGGASGSW